MASKPFQSINWVPMFSKIPSHLNCFIWIFFNKRNVRQMCNTLSIINIGFVALRYTNRTIKRNITAILNLSIINTLNKKEKLQNCLHKKTMHIFFHFVSWTMSHAFCGNLSSNNWKLTGYKSEVWFLNFFVRMGKG